MKSLFRKIFRENEPLQATLFKTLGCAGIAVSILTGVYCLFYNMISGAIVDFAAAVLAIVLVWWIDITGKYKLGYLITIFVVFIGLFTVLYFTGGGYFGAMPYFFVFGIIFTFLMLDGWILYATVIFEVLYYSGVLIISIVRPDFVTAFPDVLTQFVDVFLGVMVNSIGLGLVFRLYVKAYKKQQKIAEEASKAKSQFLANMSHEIRTPINIMLGMNEMINKENKDEKIRHYAQMSEMAGNQLLELVNQILDYSKSEAGNVELINEHYCLSEEINRISMMSGETAKEKGLEFQYFRDDNIPDYLYGDIGKIKQIIMNILSNATKYTDKGQIIFSCKLLSDKKDNIELEFIVEDTGRGIKKEDIPRLFDNFSRADLFKNRNIQGTGLGLAISKMYAVMLDGSIDVESEYGKGSKFTFRLLQTKSTKEDYQDKDKGLAENTKHTFIAPNAHILVVDDNEMNLILDKALLRSLLCKVDVALSAEEAYIWIEKYDYDLIFMDYTMPVVDGVEAMLHIREMQKNTHTPIVVLTADVMGGIKNELIEKGFDDYVSKPVKEAELQRIVFNYVNQDKIKETSEIIADLPTEDRLRYRNKLLLFDIDFDKGMEYLGNDIVQYAAALEFFEDNSQKGIKETKILLDNKDYDKLKYLTHSLKSTSGSVGASELQELARQAEKHLKSEDFGYAEKIMALLMVQWERVLSGIINFEEDINIIKKMYTNDNAENTNKEELLGKLFEYIRDCQGRPAIDSINEMLKEERWEDKAKEFESIKELIENIEFEEAEKKLREIV